MSKRPSLYHQMLTSLREQIRFGESKHAAKQIAIKTAHKKGKSGFGVAPEGIFSIVTFADYRQVAHEYSIWCTINGRARFMDEAIFWVPLYLAERICKGLSAWTIQKDRSALRKIFRDPSLAKEVVLPRRRYKDITRSRLNTKMDQEFNKEKHRDLADFSKAFGLRRHELARVNPEDVYWKEGELIAAVYQGKGGKSREVRSVSGMEERVLEIIKGKQLGQPIFSSIPSRMDVHFYRRKYSITRQEQETKNEVSKDLGHIRKDIITYHYSNAW